MSFRVKQVLLLAVVAAAVALSTCVLNAALLARSRIGQLRDDAGFVARTLYHNASGVIRRSSDTEIATALRTDEGLRDFADAVIGYSPVTLHVAIVDENGTAIFHSNPRFEGQALPEQRSLDAFAEQGIFAVLWGLWNDDGPLVVDIPFTLAGDELYGSAQVAVSSVLLRRPIFRAVLLNAAIATTAVLVVLLTSFAIANRLLAPLDQLRAELSKLPVGQGERPLDLSTTEDVGRVAQFFASMSERLAVEAESEPDSDWLGGMLDGVSDAVLVLDAEGRVLSCNASARALFDDDGDGPEGTRLDERLPAGHPVARMAADALASGEDERREPCVLERDGRAVSHTVTVRTLRRGDTPSGLMVIVRDLERLSRIASRLSYSQKLASLGRLTSGVAHEIKNPLNAIVMQSALLRRKLGDDDDALARHLDILDEEVRRLDRVVLGFLAFTRPDELRLSAVDLEAVVRRSVEKVCGDAEAEGIRVGVEVDGGRATVPGDEAMLEQVFANLLANAREAIEGGGEISVRLERAADGVRATVSDTGTGIAEDEIDKVFGLYYTTKEKGSGIGLSIVYRIVQLHGGDVSVRSRRGEGTHVTVLLPETVE